MAPPEHHTEATEIPLDGFDSKDIDALKREANKRGVSLDEVCKQMLLERARRMSKPKLKGLFGLLFGNRTVH